MSKIFVIIQNAWGNKYKLQVDSQEELNRLVYEQNLDVVDIIEVKGEEE